MRVFGPRGLVVICTLLALGVGCSDDDGDAGGGGARGSGGDGDSGDGDSGDGDSGDGDSGDGMVHIMFEARIGGEEFSCDGTYDGIGAGGDTVEPRDFRFYVHDVRLLSGSAAGGASMGVDAVALELVDNDWQHDGVALLDFEDNSGSCENGTSETNAMVMGTAPPGNYDGIAFTVGVPGELNHEDPAEAPSPLNLTALHWNWNAGYKFMRLDMNVLVDDGNDGGMDDGGVGMGVPHNFHLGSTMCTGDAPTGETVDCAKPNRPEVELGDFDVHADVVVIDYAALVEDEDLGEDLGGAPGCMSGDPDCLAIFEKLGLEFSSGFASGTQTVFSAE